MLCSSVKREADRFQLGNYGPFRPLKCFDKETDQSFSQVSEHALRLPFFVEFLSFKMRYI